jgi:hypothetical protein
MVGMEVQLAVAHNQTTHQPILVGHLFGVEVEVEELYMRRPKNPTLVVFLDQVVVGENIHLVIQRLVGLGQMEL